MDLLLVGRPAKIVHKPNRFRTREAQVVCVPQEYSLVFKSQWNRKSDLEALVTKQCQNPEGCTAARPEGGHKHLAIQHNPHTFIVSYMIPYPERRADRAGRSRRLPRDARDGTKGNERFSADILGASRLPRHLNLSPVRKTLRWAGQTVRGYNILDG
jgi:hypothetical protein